MFFAKRQTPVPSFSTTASSAWSGLLTRAFPNLMKRAPVAGVLEHLGTLPLTPHASLILVRMGDQTLLVGATAQSISLLAKDDAATVTAPTGRSATENEP